MLQHEGVKVVLTPYRRPRANAHCERVIKTIRHEALDWMLIFGERHLRLVLREYIEHYANRGSGPIIRQQRLNRLISEYYRTA